MNQPQEFIEISKIGTKKMSNESDTPKVTCTDIFSIVINILTWIFLILMLYQNNHKKNKKKKLICFLFI